MIKAYKYLILSAIKEHEKKYHTEKKEKSNKIKYLDFVKLTGDEHKKLVAKFGKSGADKRIENLNNYIGSKGKKYKSHYHTILVWEKKNERNAPNDGRDFSSQSSQYGETISV